MLLNEISLRVNMDHLPSEALQSCQSECVMYLRPQITNVPVSEIVSKLYDDWPLDIL